MGQKEEEKYRTERGELAPPRPPSASATEGEREEKEEEPADKYTIRRTDGRDRKNTTTDNVNEMNPI